MKRHLFMLASLLCLTVLTARAQMLSRGVSKELAEHRKAMISDVSYELTFSIPESPEQQVTGEAVIAFELTEKADVALDFQGYFDGECYVYNNKNKRKKISVSYQNEHIILPAKWMKTGGNKVALSFGCLDKALNRNRDYMYTLFVPDQARSAFPCFDQPDLRARFITTLQMPTAWKAITSDSRVKLPTYLYSFVAGNFQEKAVTRNGRNMRALYRETDPEKVAQLDQIFDDAAQALSWMEGYTGIVCPFTDYGLVILPNYQFGGMEHPGAIQLSDRSVFLEKNATQEEQLNRTELIAHETAHLWFGDLVSLKWFEDVWTKEVFANFMAAKITRRQYSRVDHDLNFIRTYQARAIAIDRTDGTHAIAQPLENLNHASLLYDNIIYDKAPVMMRMLERMMGPAEMQNGLSRYLNEHYCGNASWDELIETLDQEAPAAGVRQFSEVWVKQKGMPTIHTSYRDGQLTVSQTDPYGRGLCWPQKFLIKVIYDLGDTKTLTVDMQKPVETFTLPKKPDCIIPNLDGQGYGRFTLDDEYVSLLPRRLITTRNDLHRYVLEQTIHENYLMGKVTPSYFGELYRLMAKEQNPQIIESATSHMMKIVSDMTPEQRPTLELCMMDLLKERENNTFECRKSVLRTLGRNATSPEVLDMTQRIWEQHNDPTLSERDYMDMAYRLVIMRPDLRQQVFTTQRSRLKTQELRDEFDYVSRACTPDAAERMAVFNSLLKPKNRIQEPWAISTLRLLSSDVYSPERDSYIEPSILSLSYLQQTSGIFFPSKWMKTLMGTLKSQTAKSIVEKTLKEHPDYPQNLRNKVLEASWILMKQLPYVEPAKPKGTTSPKATAPRSKAKKTKK